MATKNNTILAKPHRLRLRTINALRSRMGLPPIQPHKLVAEAIGALEQQTTLAAHARGLDPSALSADPSPIHKPNLGNFVDDSLDL